MNLLILYFIVMCKLWRYLIKSNQINIFLSVSKMWIPLGKVGQLLVPIIVTLYDSTIVQGNSNNCVFNVVFYI